MHILDSPKSGRYGDVVFFMIRNRQRERAYVIPKTVRNAATKRARTAFGAFSKAYRSNTIAIPFRQGPSTLSLPAYPAAVASCAAQTPPSPPLPRTMARRLAA